MLGKGEEVSATRLSWGYLYRPFDELVMLHRVLLESLGLIDYYCERI